MLQLKELEWAQIYHDSIRGKKWLEETPLYIGRWAGNYAFFYVLNRLLNDYKPKRILEFGLGESSKFISTYLENVLTKSKHLIIEQDTSWYINFKSNFQLSTRSNVVICPLIKKNVHNVEVNCYQDLKTQITQKYDLYIVDGPFGSKHYSRYDIVTLAQDFNDNDEFIIVIDDFQREGEQETVSVLETVFKEKGLKIFKGIYTGNKSVCVLGTEKYKHISTF